MNCYEELVARGLIAQVTNGRRSRSTTPFWKPAERNGETCSAQVQLPRASDSSSQFAA